jgi:hypothetical protein
MGKRAQIKTQGWLGDCDKVMGFFRKEPTMVENEKQNGRRKYRRM